MDKTTKEPGTTAQDPDRVVLRLGPDIRKRLRLFAAIHGQSVQAVLAGWVTAQLPSQDELADAVRGGGSRDHAN